ncbi:hypothetical protein V8Q34_22495 [Blautia sp. JLR.GB0024]|jgi:hypothetical protein|uniref:hypothetical protein n=1 Tax=Blautia sp. JLR.GB0024 TaxID=3123295 RepID=UPI003003E8B1
MDNNKKIFSKTSIYAAIVGALLAFIVGKLFNPIFEFVFSLFLNIGGGFVQLISDATYKQISDGFSEQGTGVLMYVLIVVAVSAANFLREVFKNFCDKMINIIESKNANETQILPDKSNTSTRNKDAKLPTVKTVKRYYKALLFCTYFLVAILVFVYMQYAFVNAKIISSTNNIEIVSPFVSDQEYRQLKSEFHLIQNSNDYEKLYDKLQDIADKNDIKLKK